MIVIILLTAPMIPSPSLTIGLLRWVKNQLARVQAGAPFAFMLFHHDALERKALRGAFPFLDAKQLSGHSFELRDHPLLRYTRGLGWRMHCGAEVTESSTNKQHHLSPNS